MRIITPRQLRSTLCHPGPYIVYFNGKNRWINKEVIKNIYIVAENYLFLDVLEVNWEEFVKYEDREDSESMKYLILYFKTNIELKIKYPTIVQIKQIFANSEKLFFQLEQEKCLDRLNEYKLNKIKSSKNIYSHIKLTEEQKKRKNFRSNLSRKRKRLKNTDNKQYISKKTKSVISNESNIQQTNSKLKNRNFSSNDKIIKTTKKVNMINDIKDIGLKSNNKYKLNMLNNDLVIPYHQKTINVKSSSFQSQNKHYKNLLDITTSDITTITNYKNNENCRNFLSTIPQSYLYTNISDSRRLSSVIQKSSSLNNLTTHCNVNYSNQSDFLKNVTESYLDKYDSKSVIRNTSLREDYSIFTGGKPSYNL